MQFGSNSHLQSGECKKRKEIAVSPNEAHSPKLNVADKLLTLQANKLSAAPGARHVWLAMYGLPPTLRLSSEPFVLFVPFVVK